MKKYAKMLGRNCQMNENVLMNNYSKSKMWKLHSS